VRQGEGALSCTDAMEPLAFDELTNLARVRPSIMQCRYRVAALFALGLIALAAYPAAAPPKPESQQEYWAQFDRRDWSAAILAAEKLVTAAREREPPQPLPLAEALSLLGGAHFGAGDYVNAEAAYAEARQLVEEHGGAMNAALLDPLRGLGYTFAATGRHAEAAVLLDRALLISRRNYGLFDIGQQGVLRQLASSLTKLGRAPEAERHMNYLVRVAERTYGADNPQVAPTLCLVGDWYADVGEFDRAREQYRDALELVTRKLGRSHLALVEPLRGLARTYTQELYYSTLGIRTSRERVPTDADGTSNEHQAINPRYLDSDGEKALERALKIIESQPTPPRETYIETLIQLGDWRQIRQQKDRALPLYRRAAALIAEDDAAQSDESSEHKEGKPAPLSFPVRIYYPTPWLATRNLTLSSDQVDETFVQVEFTVTREGDVTDARVVEKNGTSRQVAESLEAIRGARFRPRFTNGEAVDTPAVTHREVFKTRKQQPADGQS
jgi:TonB family protein